MAGGYRVGADLSSCVRFAASDVESATQCDLQDGAVDLVSCRNLLIYFMRHKQDRVVARFRHALAPEGLLFLGLSENLSPGTRSSFLTLDPDHRLFSRRA
jgi:chemotaxis methyl-accepting protein methylase